MFSASIYFIMREHKHEINTRNKRSFHTGINKFKTFFGHKSIKVLAAHMFNVLPLQIKELQSVFFLSQ